MATSPFNARMNLSRSEDRFYRVYVRTDLYFIRTGGQWAELLLGSGRQHFGLAGILIDLFVGKRMRAKQAALIEALDRTDPATHLADHKANFKLSVLEIKDGSLDPSAFFGGHGPHAGRWTLNLMDGRTLSFQFSDAEQMRVAVATLPAVLGSRLAVNVEWDEAKQKFLKRTGL